MNDLGEVVAVVCQGPYPPCEGPFIWNSLTGHIESAPSSVSPSYLNNAGQVVGRAADGPVLWDRLTGMVYPIDIAGASFGGPIAINDRGQLVGRVTYDVLTNASVAFWESHDADPILFGNLRTYAEDINEAGQAIGNQGVDGWDTYWPWVWDPTTRLTTTLPVTGQRARAAAINDLGQIVGWSDGRAVLWNPT